MKNNRYLLIIGVIVLLIIAVAFPSLITLIMGQNVSSISHTIKVTLLFYILPLTMVFLINYFILVPYIYDKKHRYIFWLLNILSIGSLNYPILFFNPSSLPKAVQEGFYSYMVILVLINFIIVALAIGLRYIIRQNKIQERLKEEKHKSTEAELNWLKNQINPHFLFNTLNNISGLTYIDVDAAQEKIAQLSDLLRYALYQSNDKKVTLTSEIEFMHNYIDLMKLRCNEMTRIEVDMTINDKNKLIAPLLFISPIENAFKHGTSSSKESFIKISLRDEKNSIVFICDNSNLPKDDKERSGSGIGIENMKRRLELIYPDKYTYEQNIVNNIYHVKITIKDENDKLHDNR